MSAKQTNNLREWSKRLDRGATRVVAANANAIVQGAQRRTNDQTNTLDRSMHVVLIGKHAARVDVTAFYAGFVEYGTRHASPHPFLTPAAEVQRPQFKRDLRDVMR